MSGCTTPKTPGIWDETVENTPYISVKKSAIFYDGRILGESQL